MNVRNRLVNFRVTDDELRCLKTASTLRQARCLSDFARSVILESALGPDRGPEPHDLVTGQMLSFGNRLARLESAVARLVSALETADTFATRSQR